MVFLQAWGSLQGSQVKAWVFTRAPSLLANYEIQTFVSQAPWDCQKFHCVFQLFLLSFLDFALHSLRFIKCFTEKIDAKCWAFLNIPFLWDIGTPSFGHFRGSINQPQKPNLLYGLKRKPRIYRMILHLLILFLFQHYSSANSKSI